MRQHPEDCAIQIVYSAKEAQKFQFTRLNSDGEHHQRITLDSGGKLTIEVPEAPEFLRPRFSIAFMLPDDYSSGGFAGIKIWPQGGEKPILFQHRPGLVDGTPFYLHVHPDPRHEITMLSLSATFEAPGRFRYSLGLAVADGLIESHDPEIHNTGPVGEWG